MSPQQKVRVWREFYGWRWVCGACCWGGSARSWKSAYGAARSHTRWHAMVKTTEYREAS